MKTREQEAKMTKVVEDNSVVLERMKSVSSTCDTILQTIDNMQATTESLAKTTVIEPQFLATEPPPELEEETKTEETPKVMLKAEPTETLTRTNSTRTKKTKPRAKKATTPKTKTTSTRKRRRATTKKTSEE